MPRPKQQYRIKQNGHRDGLPFFDVYVDGKKHRLAARDRVAAGQEAEAYYHHQRAKRTAQPEPSIRPGKGTLREALALYRASRLWNTYKPLTKKQRASSFNLIATMPAACGRHALGESLLSDWLHGIDGREAVIRVMAACGDKVAAAHHRRVALTKFFEWLLDPQHPDAAEARAALHVNLNAVRNPCDGVKDPKPLPTKGKRRGHAPFDVEQVRDWLHCYRDDPEIHRAIRFLQITGARVSDLRRLNRGMIRETPSGRVLQYLPAKGEDSAYRSEPMLAVVPMVPELQALIDEVPRDRFTFIHSSWDRPFFSVNSLSNTVRKWRREAGLPEGLSAHGMRKAATHWWLRHHRELIQNNFSLQTIFGWATEKELERDIRDFDREAEAEGMLIKHAELIEARAAREAHRAQRLGKL